jgi:hypothetical protein
MGMDIKGTIHTVFEAKTFGAKGFTKREFVVTTDDPKYPQTVLFEITGDKIGQLNGVNPGDSVSVAFNLRGREWKSPSGEVKFFNSLDCWKLEVTSKGQSDSAPASKGWSGEGDSGLPF